MNQLYFTRCTLLWVLALVPFWLKAELTIVVNSVPTNTPMGEIIYLSGSFNNWLAAEPATKLERIGSGRYQIKIQPPVGPVHFTFTRGHWGVAEGNETGEYQAVHVVNYKGQAQTVLVDIRNWRVSTQTAFNNDKKGTVAVVEDSFHMPQLNRTRRICVYLPPNYYTQVGKKYPVLYLQEGETLFQKSATQDEWEVDETLDKLVTEGNYGCIVVGIEGGGVNMMNEYSPWLNTTYGVGGQGAAYMTFIVNTLKPFIDQHFSTNPIREYTGIGGSGFGALISLYGATEYQHVFSKVLLFSPSFWFSEIPLKNHILGKGKQSSIKMYFMVGGQEAPYIIQGVQNIVNTLYQVGFNDNEVSLQVPAEGRSVISFWQKKYPEAYLWLFGGLTTSTTEEASDVEAQYAISIYPNPATDWIRVRSGEGNEWQQIQIVGLDGSIKRDVWVYGEEAIPVYDLPKGAYAVRIRSEYAEEWRAIKMLKR